MKLFNNMKLFYNIPLIAIGILSSISNVPKGKVSLPKLVRFSSTSMSPIIAPHLVRFLEKSSFNNEISFLSAYDKV